MKKFAFTLVVLVFSAPLLFAGNVGPDSLKNEKVPYTDHTSLLRDEQVSISGKYMHDGVYFQLRMLNESRNGFYSLVREYTDGKFESVDVREMVANTINTPLLYSFADKDVPDVDVSYVLYRISDESVEVQRWNYCADEKQLCQVRYWPSVSKSDNH